MKFPHVDWAVNGILDGLRMTVGTDDEIDTLLAAMKEIV
jgi:histidinol-phosphate/aromatic aminotransferase/cobyric acid decarboxylase-like protein